MVWLIVLGVLAVGGAIGVRMVRRKIRQAARTLFNTDTFREGIQKQELEYSETPKSISDTTSIYLPQITRDFPDFHLKQFITKAENMLCAAFHAIEAKDLSKADHASEDIKQQIKNHIEDLDSKGEKEHFDNIRIHRTAINRYTRTQGLCTVVLQTSLEYIHFTSKDGAVIRGSDRTKKQTRYSIDLLYIQDVDQMKNGYEKNALGLTCPSCGAPVKTLGQKFCEFCGTGVREIQTHVWQINSYKEI